MRSPFGESLYVKGRYYPKDRVAIVYGDKKITWKELNARVNKLANALLDLGVRKGTKCAILFRNTPEFIESNFAIQKFGAVPVPINYRYAPSELEYVLNNSDSEVLIFDCDVLETVQQVRDKVKVKRYICFGKKVDWALDYEELMKKYPRKEPRIPWELGDDDLAIICYTGGTTGMPKGVMLSYGNLVKNLESVSEIFVTALPPVEEIALPIYAKNEFQRRLLDGMAGGPLLAPLYSSLIQDPKMADKVFVMDSDIFSISLTSKQGKPKAFNGAAEKWDLKITARLGEQLRILSRKLPLAHSHIGRMKLFPWVLFTFPRLVKVEGPVMLRLKLLRSLIKSIKVAPQLRLLLVPPLFHMAGYIFMMSWLAQGGIAALPASRRFDAREILEMISKEKMDWVTMVPTMWQRVIEHPEIRKFDLSSVKIAISGGALFRGKFKKHVLGILPNAILLDGFGQTEMAPITFAKFDGDASEVRDRSIGIPLSCVETRIVDENGKDVPTGKIGELIYRGPTVMLGYYKDEKKTSEVMKDGWFHSGDLAYRGEDGEIYIVERKTECIVSGAEKIYPEEVEEVIEDHPSVECCCVIGIPDEEWGESVCAVIQLKNGKKATAEEIIDFCKGKIAGYKKPKSVVFVDSLPVTPVGKVMRAKVKELYGRGL